MYQGKFWKLNIYDKSGRLYTPAHFEKAFETILYTGLATNGSHIGALTCSDRTGWFKVKTNILCRFLTKCINFLNLSEQGIFNFVIS